MRIRKNIFLSILSALLLILAFPPFDCELLAWVAFIPLLFAFKNSRHSFLLGYLFGLVFFGGALFWLTNITRIGFLILILYLALYPAFFTFLITKWNFAAKNFFGACLWILLEYVVSHFLTGFPWLLLGYSQYQNLRLIQISSIFGVYVISGFIILINIGLSELFVKRRRISVSISFLVLIIVFGYGVYREKESGLDKSSPYNSRASSAFQKVGVGFIRPAGLINQAPTKKIKVAIIQGNIPSSLRWEPTSKEENLETYLELTKKANKAEQALLLQKKGVATDKNGVARLISRKQSEPELIIWPESAVNAYLRLDEPIQRTLFESVKEGNFYLLTGTLDSRKGKDFNSAFLISPEGRIVQTYNKMHLVPYGEYIPGERFPFLKRLATKFITKAAGFAPNFSSGKSWTIFSLPAGNFGTLICFEDIFPKLSRGFTKKGANFLVNVTNDSWFGSSGASQHFAISIFRAVENRRYLLRAANTGVSGVIAPSGKILRKVEKNGKSIFVSGFLNEEIYPSSSLSFYTKFGDTPLILICLGMIVILITTKIKKM